LFEEGVWAVPLLRVFRVTCNFATGLFSIGHTKINRLEFIADRCPALQIEALKLAITELKNTQTLNIPRYANLVKKLNDAVKFGAPGSANVSSDLLNIDKAWADRQLQKAKQQTEMLEAELKNYKRNSIKESIRVIDADLIVGIFVWASLFCMLDGVVKSLSISLFVMSPT